MKYFSFIKITLLCIFFSASCSSRVKSEPVDDYIWAICSNCHGHGKITTVILKGSADDVSKHPGNKYAFCLIPFAVLGDAFDDTYPSRNSGQYENRDNEYDIFDTDKNQRIMIQRVPARSTVEKKITCPRCDGKGWIQTKLKKNSAGIKER